MNRSIRDKSRLPQSSYFAASHAIPGTQWIITGHSRALERTGFYIPQLRCAFDAGVDLPIDSGARALAIFVTHGHIDHCNALPMLLRHRQEGDAPTAIFAPWKTVHRLRQLVQLSWAVKVDVDDEPLPDAYAPPPEEDRLPAPGTALEGDLPRRTWMPCATDTEAIIRLGKKGATPIKVRSLRLFHGCSAVGYLLSEPAKKVKKLRPDLLGEDKKSTARNVKEARRRGEEINVFVETPEVPRFAFVLDTTVDALDESKSDTARRILDCPAVMIECTYLDEDMKEEGRKRGHVTWCELAPFVIDSARRRREGRMSQTWYLVHFSLRYTDGHIVDFFGDEARCKVKFVGICNTDEGEVATPPDVVLWVDTGPVELWVNSVEDEQDDQGVYISENVQGTNWRE